MPDNLSRKLAFAMSEEEIELTQKTLLYQSLINSTPATPKVLQEYEVELARTAYCLYDREKANIIQDELKDGTFASRIQLTPLSKRSKKKIRRKKRKNAITLVLK
jgi:hypothetical protein